MARVSAIKYQETVWSDVFPGNRSTLQCLQPAVLAVESSFDLGQLTRQHVLYRLDGGSGTDENLRWLLARGYQMLGKGYSARRAKALSRHVIRWDEYNNRCWLGRVKPTFDLGRPIDVIVKRWQHQQKWKYAYYVTTLTFPSKGAFMAAYDQRGGAEVEQFRNDKQGLHLSARRMRKILAQKAIVLFTDVAHNLLTDFRRRGLVDSPYAKWGATRIVKCLMNIRGRLYFEGGQLKRIELDAQNPYAKSLICCLEKYCAAPFSE